MKMLRICKDPFSLFIKGVKRVENQKVIYERAARIQNPNRPPIAVQDIIKIIFAIVLPICLTAAFALLLFVLKDTGNMKMLPGVLFGCGVIAFIALLLSFMCKDF